MALTLNGTTGIAGANGSASTPAVQGEDTNTGVFFPAANTVAVATGGSERFRVDSSGNVGVGKSPEAQSGFTILDVGSGSTSGLLDLRQNSNRQTRIYNSSDNSVLSNNTAGGSLLFITADSGSATFERARIDSSGNLLVGTTATLPANGAEAFSVQSGQARVQRGVGGFFVVFYNGSNSAEIGKISNNGGTSTTYATSSD